MHSHHEHEHEPNLYKARVRRWLAEYPYPLPTSEQLTCSGFTPQEVAEALAEAYAVRRDWAAPGAPALAPPLRLLAIVYAIAFASMETRRRLSWCRVILMTQILKLPGT